MTLHGILKRGNAENISWRIRISEIERPGQRARCINLCMPERRRRKQRIRERHVEDMERVVGAMHSMARTQVGEARSRDAVR